ncbi:MAG: rhomboid family intramembrane serine protease [Proteobacteria bacterium]|nr:MAG: rhomboid family intramembrane serine protease [Pseudomonadota bacterium]
MAKAEAAPIKRGAKERLKANLILIGIMLAVLWGIEIIDQISGGALDAHGIHPRQTEGLIGLVTSPLLHADFGHLTANSVPFAVLGFFILLRGLGDFIKVTVVTALVGGLAVWLVAGSNTNHIGASGVIFGYFGYLIAVGIFERSFKSIAVAAVVGVMYGGMVFGVLPGQPGVSWEGHLFGFLAGGGFGYFSSRKVRAAKAKSST